MKDRIRRDGQFWQNALVDQARSKLTIAAYCRENELSQATFYKWKKRLSQTSEQTCRQKTTQQVLSTQDAETDVPGELVELAVALSPVCVSTPNGAQPQRLLEASRADGTLLRFHGSFDPDTINQIIAGRSLGQTGDNS